MLLYIERWLKAPIAILSRVRQTLLIWFFAYKWLVEVSKKFPSLFVHWDYGFRP